MMYKIIGTLLLAINTFSGVATAADKFITRQKSIVINPQQLDAAPQINIELFDGLALTLDRVKVEWRAAENFTWHGKVRGFSDSIVMLTVVDGFVAGIVVFNGSAYQIIGNDVLMTLSRIDPTSFPKELAPVVAPTIFEPLQKAVTAMDSGDTVEIMILYSQEAASTSIIAEIQLAVDTANTVFANSGVTTSLKLIYSGPSYYYESGDFLADLAWLVADSISGSGITAQLRSAYHPDLISMFVVNSSSCGIGHLGADAGGPLMSVVSRSCAVSAYTLAHEVGHNFGALHDPFVDSTTFPKPYGHGYVDVGERWRDVMSYPDACQAVGVSGCNRIPYYSNPLLTYGIPPHPLGTVEKSNVAQLINENKIKVANFAASVGGQQTCIVTPPTLPPATSANVASQANGGIATASSYYDASYAPSMANDGNHLAPNDRRYWSDATPGARPDWLQITFNGTKSINKAIVFSQQDNNAAPVEPSDTMTCSFYCLRDFEVQGWSGAAWVTLATVNGNNLVKRTVPLTTYTTDRVRFWFTGSPDAWTRVPEVEVY